jgi:hypothetical protein
MVRLPAHGPLVDVVQLAAIARAPTGSLVTLSILKVVLLAISHCSRDGAGSSAGMRGSHPKMEVVGTMLKTGFGSGSFNCFVPLSPASLLNLRPFYSPSTAMKTSSPALQTPDWPLNMTLRKLIVLPVWYGKPNARKPLAAIVVQITGQFLPKVFQNLVLSYVVWIHFRRFWVPNYFLKAVNPLNLP